MGLHWLVHSWFSSSDFPLIIFWGVFIMRFHGVNLLRLVVELVGLGALVADGTGFHLFKWLLNDVLFRVFLENFALFGRVPWPCNMNFIFCTGRCNDHMTCITFPALSSESLFRVGWRGGSSSILLPANTDTVGF